MKTGHGIAILVLALGYSAVEAGEDFSNTTATPLTKVNFRAVTSKTVLSELKKHRVFRISDENWRILLVVKSVKGDQLEKPIFVIEDLRQKRQFIGEAATARIGARMDNKHVYLELADCHITSDEGVEIWFSRRTYDLTELFGSAE